MGEWFRDNGKHAVIIFDDLSKQVWPPTLSFKSMLFSALEEISQTNVQAGSCIPPNVVASPSSTRKRFVNTLHPQKSKC
jgi:hypothetical protein